MSGTQVIPNAVHDVRWITDDGRPNGGFLQIFNNSGVSNNQSAIDGIETPWDAATNTYLRSSGQPFSPASYSTRYECAYSASGQSASDRMSNGNIYVNASSGQGGAGVMYEVDELGIIVWGPYNAQSPKGFRYECEYPGIIALEPFMTNTTSTSCFDATPISENDEVDNLVIYPNPAIDHITINNQEVKEIYNLMGVRVIRTSDTDIDVNHLASGIYNLRVANRNIKFIKQ